MTANAFQLLSLYFDIDNEMCKQTSRQYQIKRDV